MNNGLKETQSTVLNEGDMIITNPSGEQYRVSADIFKERYTADPDNNGEYFPNPIPQKMLFLTEDISFRAYWGEDMHIKKGGTLNITDYEIGHIYGIQPSEFQETYTSYSIMDEDKKN